MVDEVHRQAQGPSATAITWWKTGRSGAYGRHDHPARPRLRQPGPEPARRTSRDAYPERFRMTEADIENAIEVPAVPPLRS
ncbi:non-oxidative hydroxyarylic acid decarboxylases subunit D [Streptomyces sp. NPDC051104]|uniref:non-oxidative hydroxyarylic acid decarboxylases subunit D n=1 Tax=Streptomyces sp. NPDC051104 TaxID=3155044 RepID=UPI003433F033